MLKNISTRLPDVQQELRAILPPDAILVGQSLHCDLVALQVCEIRATVTQIGGCSMINNPAVFLRREECYLDRLSKVVCIR